MAEINLNTYFTVNDQNPITDEILQSKDIRIITRNGDSFRLLYKNKAFDAQFRRFDITTKEALINVSGFDFKIIINEPLDQLIHELGFLKASKHSVKEIKSPMPGLVVNIFVCEGDQVEEGQKLLSLEAMKMENILKSPGEGIIKTISVSNGNSVEKNQVLIEFE
jgi:biotin carboxyl carrier protein